MRVEAGQESLACNGLPARVSCCDHGARGTEVGEDTPLLEENPVSERGEPPGTATHPLLERASLNREPLAASAFWGEQSFYLSSTTGQPVSPDRGTVLTLNTTSRVGPAYPKADCRVLSWPAWLETEHRCVEIFVSTHSRSPILLWQSSG